MNCTASCTVGLVLLLAAVGFGTAMANKVDPDGDMKRMEGSWQVKEMSQGGESAPKEIVAAAGYVIAGGELQPTVNGKIREGAAATIKLNERSFPKTIDLAEKDTGETSIGIYELKSDRLRICFVRRPKNFDAKDVASKTSLIFLERVK